MTAVHLSGESYKISSKLPDLVDMYISIREQRLVADRKVAELKETEEEIKKTIISKFQEQGLKVLGGDTGTVKMTELDEPVAENWELVWDYVAENNAWHLLHKRLTSTAVRELWNDGQTIPGIGHQTVYKLSVSGVKK